MSASRGYPSLQEVYARFGIAEPKHTAQETSSWQAPAKLGEELRGILGATASRYTLRPLPPFVYEGDKFPPPDIEQEKRFLFDDWLISDPGLHCEVFEVAGISSMITREKKQWALWLKLKREGQTVCNGFLLHDAEQCWNFSHRWVDSNYRGKGLFRHLSDGLESFVQRRAEVSSSPQKVFLSTGQPDVVLTFLKRGYGPTDAGESEKLERMLGHGSGLILAYARRPLVMRGGDEHETIPLSQTSPYYFETAKIGDRDDESSLTIENAFRVRLEKKFIP